MRNTITGRVPPQRLPALLEEWAALDIHLAEPTSTDGMLPFGLSERLSLFDAAYLALAVELEAELATRDAALAAAGRLHGLRVHDLRDL